jgi:hypothetical protein
MNRKVLAVVGCAVAVFIVLFAVWTAHDRKRQAAELEQQRQVQVERERQEAIRQQREAQHAEDMTKIRKLADAVETSLYLDTKDKDRDGTLHFEVESTKQEADDPCVLAVELKGNHIAPSGARSVSQQQYTIGLRSLTEDNVQLYLYDGKYSLLIKGRAVQGRFRGTMVYPYDIESAQFSDWGLNSVIYHYGTKQLSSKAREFVLNLAQQCASAR